MSDKRENSVLFSLKELRKIEKDRVQQQEEDDRRKADEDRRRAEEEERRRRAEEERRIREEEERVRAEEAARKAQAAQSDVQAQLAAERERLAQQYQQQMMMEQQRLRNQMAAEMSAAAPASAAAAPPQKQGKGMMIGLIIGMVVLGAFAAFAFVNGNSKEAAAKKEAKEMSDKMLAQLKELNDGQKTIQGQLDDAKKENKALAEKLASAEAAAKKAQEEADALKAQASNTPTEPEDSMKPGSGKRPMTGPSTSTMDPPPPMTMRCNPNDPTCFE